MAPLRLLGFDRSRATTLVKMRQALFDHGECIGINGVVDDEFVTLRKQRKDQRAEGRHPRGEYQPSIGSFEIGEPLFEDPSRRVVFACVEVFRQGLRRLRLLPRLQI